MSRITIEWSDEDHVFIAEVNGQKTHGDTRAEALKNAEEVLLMLEENATYAELLAEARAFLLAAKQIRFTNVKNYPLPENWQHGNRLVGPDKCSMDIKEEEHRELNALRAWFAKHLRAAYRKGKRSKT